MSKNRSSCSQLGVLAGGSFEFANLLILKSGVLQVLFITRKGIQICQGSRTSILRIKAYPHENKLRVYLPFSSVYKIVRFRDISAENAFLDIIMGFALHHNRYVYAHSRFDQFGFMQHQNIPPTVY